MGNDTQDNLKKTTEMVTTMDNENRKIQPAFKKMSDGLEAAIKDVNKRMIALYRPQLEKVVEEIDDCMSVIDGALMYVGELQKDKAFAEARFEVIEKLLKKVTTTQKLLTTQLAQARDLDKQALKALDDKDTGAAAEAEQTLAVLKDSVADLKKAVDYSYGEVPKLEAAARKAYADRKQNILTDARVKLIDFDKYYVPAQGARAKVNKFLKEKPEHDLATEANYLLDDLQEIDDKLVEVKKLVQELLKLGQVKQINVGAAARVLAIDSKEQPKLAKVLNGPSEAFQKGLDILAKNLDLDMTGKEMLSKLEKADVV